MRSGRGRSLQGSPLKLRLCQSIFMGFRKVASVLARWQMILSSPSSQTGPDTGQSRPPQRLLSRMARQGTVSLFMQNFSHTPTWGYCDPMRSQSASSLAQRPRVLPTHHSCSSCHQISRRHPQVESTRAAPSQKTRKVLSLPSRDQMPTYSCS